MLPSGITVSETTPWSFNAFNCFGVSWGLSVVLALYVAACSNVKLYEFGIHVCVWHNITYISGLLWHAAITHFDI